MRKLFPRQGSKKVNEYRSFGRNPNIKKKKKSLDFIWVRVGKPRRRRQCSLLCAYTLRIVIYREATTSNRMPPYFGIMVKVPKRAPGSERTGTIDQLRLCECVCVYVCVGVQCVCACALRVPTSPCVTEFVCSLDIKCYTRERAASFTQYLMHITRIL